ncbi:MAG: diaminopimelate epimerase [Flavobacteriales bacterium]|nr:diaminopimelate epimerase [Flavobacteriales bacterium]
MLLRFSKWHGTGNDFILVDDRAAAFPVEDHALVRRLCDRHFGIGSDGLILLQAPREPDTQFHMEFFNPDASRSFCGNGSRCAFAFWSTLAGGAATARFTAIDGVHEARWDGGLPCVSLLPPKEVERIDERMDFLHTGSPHLLVWVDDPETIDILPEARAHRYSERFAKEGVNVNFLRWHNGCVEMRTYERGVEAETLSCGTGVTAAAIGAIHRGHATGPRVAVHTRGGELSVEVGMDAQQRIETVHLIGPAVLVYEGSIG